MRVNPRREDAGAAAVTMTIVFAMLLGAAAIAVDYGAFSVQERRVQNAADAAALAIAQECAVLGPGCRPTMSGSSGAPYVSANSDNRSTGSITRMTPTSVDVQVDRPVDMTFGRLAGLLDDSDEDPQAVGRARASWNNIPSQVEGPKFIPLGINICTYSRMFSSPGSFPSTSQTIQGGGMASLLSAGQRTSCSVNGRSYSSQLDRFVWLTGLAGLVDLIDVGACNYRTRPLTTNFVSTTLNDLLAPLLGCSGVVSRLRVGEEIVVPIYESRDFLNGVRIVGYAAFEISGWKLSLLGILGLQRSWPSAPCTGLLDLRTCISGRFVRDTDDSAAIDYTKPGGLALDLGLLKIRIEDLT